MQDAKKGSDLRIMGDGNESTFPLRPIETAPPVEAIRAVTAAGRSHAARTSAAPSTASTARTPRAPIGFHCQRTSLRIDQIQPAMTGRGYAHLEK